MKIKLSASTVMLIGLAVLTSCSGHQTQNSGIMTGTIQIVGGPAPGTARGLPGIVTATNGAGRQYSVKAYADGRFRLSLPAGIYAVTGKSPLGCTMRSDVHVVARTLTPGIRVFCSVP